MQSGIRVAHSSSTNAREAAREFHASVTQPDMALVLFFCSSEYDLDALGAEINLLFAGVPTIGCTTAGEIGPEGYGEHSVTGVSLSQKVCAAVVGHIDALQTIDMSGSQAFGRGLTQELRDKAPDANEQNSFALLLIDGLSMREEPVSRLLQIALGEFPLVGGSAGDGLRFRRAAVYADGAFRSDRAALALVASHLPMRLFKTQHFVPTDNRLVITEADPAQRVVKEINGLPAAEEYARILGVTVSDLSSKLFAAAPVVVLIDGNNYVRSIQKVNPDGSLTFYCAIEEGVVLRVARGVDLVDNLEHAFSEIRSEIGPPELVLGCDCILRRLEIAQNGLESRVADIFRLNNAVGFSTYGEQFRGVHVNQTLTGVALGAAQESCDG